MVHRILVAALVALYGLVCSGVASAQSAAPPVAAAVLAESVSSFDPWLDDPWLTDVGPMLAEPSAENPHDRVIEAWLAAPPTPQARTAALRRLRLEYGLGDLRAPAQVVQSAMAPEDAAIGTALARELAPGMPALAWAHVRDLWRGHESGAAVKAFGAMIWEMGQQLESRLWLIGNGMLLMWIVALASAASFVVLLGLKSIPHAAHDLGDLLSGGMPAFARVALLASVLLLPLWLGEGLAGVTLALFCVAFLYGPPRERSVLVMAAIALVVALHPLAQWASIAATLVDLDPVSRSALAVTKGTASRADVDRLEAAFDDDVIAAHAIAYRARRFGLDELAKERLEALAERFPVDPVVLANRANIEMRSGQTKAAIDHYERAAAQLDSPALLFDLSQAYASVLRMDESEATLKHAQRIGDDEVAALSSLSDPRLVADIAFPVGTLGDRLRTLGLTRSSPIFLTQVLAPGRLGAGVGTAAIGFAIAALLGIFLGGRFDRSSVCTRCGHRICTRCESTVWSNELCEGCHHLFKNPEATDPKLRMARLQVLSRRESVVNGLVDLGSVVVPGVAGLSMRRPDLALLGIALFVWLMAWRRWPAGVLVDPLWLGALGPMCFAVFGSLALLAYAAIVVAGLMARRNR